MHESSDSLYPTSYVDGYDAINTMIHSCRTAPKELAYLLVQEGIWPELKHESLMAKFRACQNPNREDERFSWAAIVAMEQASGRHDPLFYHCDLLGRTRPPLIANDQAFTRLSNRIDHLMDVMHRVQAELDQLVAKRAIVSASERATRQPATKWNMP
jgi:hypothetical protein